MKKTMIMGVLAFALMAGSNVSAQIKLPPASSAQTVTQGLGISKATLVYSRPNMNGRKIFGGLVPYGEVWRTGANTVTALTTEGEITVAGHSLPAGTYGILTIPTENEWTVIFSKNSQQWGAYTYDQTEDQLRFTVKPQKLANSLETFTIDFSDVAATSAKLNISWENTKISIDLEYNQDAEIMASIDEAMRGDKKPYFQAAQYYYNNDKDLSKALDWMEEALKSSPDAPYVYYWKARTELKAGKKTDAAATAQKGIEVATKANNSEYVTLNTQVLREAQK